MLTEYTSALIPYFLSLAITVILALYALPRLRANGALSFLWLAIGECIWILGYIFELLAPTLETKILWDSIQYYGTFMMLAALLLMPADTDGKRWLRSGKFQLPLHFAIVLTAAVFITFRHSPLFCVQPHIQDAPPFGALFYNFGPIAYSVNVFMAACALVALVNILITIIKRQGIYKWQLSLILTGILIPFAAAILLLLGIEPFPQRDNTPVFFGLGNMFLAWAIFRYRALDLVPIAREIIIEKMGDGVIVTDTSGRILDINPAARTIIASAESIIGRSITTLPTPWPSILEDSNAVRELNLPGTEERTWYELKETALHDKKGKTIGRLFALRNITDRKKVEEELRLAHNELEIRVFDRTAELRASNDRLRIEVDERESAQKETERLQEQLLQSQKMESIGRLAGGVAHDFNNLLTGITGYAEMAGSCINQESPAHGMLKEICVIADRAAALTRQLLAFSRKQILEPKVTSLNELVTTMQKMLVRIIGEDIRLECRLTDEPNAVLVDRSQIEQVLLNLSVNARDAMPGGGSLTIETMPVEFDAAYCADHPFAREGKYARIAVSDSGCGIAKADLEKIFEPFFTTKPVGKGTGLGLSMVWGAVKQNNGFIEVYSEINQGTCFKVYFPLVNEIEAVTTQENQQNTPVDGTETILLVEDDPTVRIVAERILSHHGYTIVAAVGPEEALDFIEHFKPGFQLMLTDVVMPGMNGRELSEKVKALRPDMRILFSSGYTQDIIVQHGVLEKGIDFIGKPYKAHDLLVKVRAVLDA